MKIVYLFKSDFLNYYISNDYVKEKEIVLYGMLVMTSCNMVISVNVFLEVSGTCIMCCKTFLLWFLAGVMLYRYMHTNM